jgi:hypothetical protein
VPAGEGPDLALSHTAEVRHFANDGVLESIDDAALAGKGLPQEPTQRGQGRLAVAAWDEDRVVEAEVGEALQPRGRGRGVAPEMERGVVGHRVFPRGGLGVLSPMFRDVRRDVRHDRALAARLAVAPDAVGEGAAERDRDR